MMRTMSEHTYQRKDSITIVSGWLTTNAIFTSTSILISYGIMESLLYGVIAAFSVILCYLLLTLKKPKKQTVASLSTFNGPLKIGFIVYYYWKILILCLGGGFTISIFLRLPFKISLFIFLVLSLVYYYLKIHLRFRYYFKIFSISLFITCWMVIVYIIDGVDVIYKGMRLYHPYLFYINWHHLIFFSIAVILVFMGKLFFDRTFVFHTTYKNLTFRSATLIGLTYSSLPISFTALSFSAIYQGIFENTYTIFRDLFSSVDKVFFSFLFLILLF